MVASERISFRELFLSLFADPWRKLVALGLAIMLWYYLDAQVSQSDEVELPLSVAHVAGDLDTSGGKRLFVRLDTTTYSAIAFEDPVTGETRRDVRLYLTGAKRLMEAIEENPGFAVHLEPAPDQGELVASFTADEVRPMNSRFEGLIARMSPPRILVRLGLNVERPVVLDRDKIQFVAPAMAQDLGDRLLWDDARLDPKVVKLRGPAQRLAAIGDQQPLFRLGPEVLGAGATRIEGVMRALTLGPNVTVVPDTVAYEIPIRIEPRTVRLPDVPVLLHEPDELRGRFKLRRESADVEIEAFRTLEAKLSGLSPEERRRWARDNAQLIASVPRDAVDSSFITNPRLVIRDYFERTDYRMTVPPTIHFDRKSP
jgi:hypothetical protein